VKVRDCFQALQLKKYIDNTLGQGDLREAVRLPTGEDLNEWLAVHSKKKILDPHEPCFVLFFTIRLGSIGALLRWTTGGGMQYMAIFIRLNK
jgi:hypothetical protein